MIEEVLQLICFAIPLDTQTFWIALSAVGTLTLSFFGFKAFMRDNKLKHELLQNAISVKIFPDGVFTIINTFMEPIILRNISQRLIEVRKAGKIIREGRGLIRKSKRKGSFDNHPVNKTLLTGLELIYFESKTHLPRGYEEAYEWIVETVISYESIDRRRYSLAFKHRFSAYKEPRSRWVEEF